MFRFSALAVEDAGRLVAGAPVFETDFRLDLAAEGAMQKVAQWLDRNVPKLNRVKVIGLGSPHADEICVGIDPALDNDGRQAAFDALLAGLEGQAASTGASVMALKNISASEAAEFGPVLVRRGYAAIATLPVSKLAIPDTVEAYIDGLSQNMRSNLRRRLKRAAKLEVEIRPGGADISDVAPELFELRELTRTRAMTDYDAFALVAPGYFASVMKECGPMARLLLYRREGRLIGFSLVLLEEKRLKEKYTGMRYPEGPDNGVFYFNWVQLVRLCIENGIPQLHSGETTYLIKARLGCKFHRSWIYFRHRRAFANAVLKRASRWASLDAADPDLKELGDSAPYADAVKPSP
jgi:predicted N-acyltransferase